MLENNKQYNAKITNYALGLSKTGNKPYLTIDFDIDGIGVRWFGMPMKNTGEINDLFKLQLAEAGFDFSRCNFSDLSKGYGSSLLNETGTVKIRVHNKMNGQGNMEWSVAWIGESKSVSKDEIAAALPAGFDDLLKANAPKANRPAEDMIPF